jgi:hypothetical protein
MTPRILAALAVLALAPLSADAQSYRCAGKDGKRYYGSTVPAECYGRPVEELGRNGMVVKRIDPQGEEKERLAKEAAEAKKREQETAARESARRNRALLATYTSEKDIEDARTRALAENTKAVREVEVRIEAIRKRQAGYEKELATSKENGEGSARVREDLQSAENDLKANEQLLEAKRREMQSINARYDEDRKRYVQITSGR